MTRPRAPWLTLADLCRIWACAARVPVDSAGTVPYVRGLEPARAGRR